MVHPVSAAPPTMPEGVRLTLRLIGLAVGVVIGWQTGALLALAGDPQDRGSSLFLLALAVGGIGYILGPHVTGAVFRNLGQKVRSASAVDLVAIGAGAAFGGLVAALLAVPLALLPDPLGSVLPFATAVVAVSLAIGVFLLRKRDLIAPLLRLRAEANPAEGTLAPGTTTAPTPASATIPEIPAILLDTSVIIDGRIVDLVRTGFLDARLQVPRFVLEELQHIADSDDPLRRQRGRRGLDTLKRLQQDRPQQVDILDVDVDRAVAREVDAKLVRLAKDRGLKILTNDYNLHRVAQIQGTAVLNLNELANALRPPVLPGEELILKLVQEGREADQGVGFLEDGTMVVVDGGRHWVGQQTSVTVTRLHQTGAGRMVFAIPKHASN